MVYTVHTHLHNNNLPGGTRIKLGSPVSKFENDRCLVNLANIKGERGEENTVI